MYRDKILETYRSRFNELSPAKRFHFASRLNQTSPDDWTRRQLDDLDGWFFGGDDDDSRTSKLISLGTTEPDSLHLNAASERLPFFSKYPRLFGYELQLFQVLHAKTQYAVDILPLPDGKMTTEEIDALANDARALAILSTYLVDVFYLHSRLVKQDEEKLISLATIDAALDVDFDPIQRPRLNVYLLTHCIIGETLFYSRKIPAKKNAYYRQLADRLIRLAEAHWNILTLDNKLEIALCLQLVGVQSELIRRAITEADVNYDETAGFITDPKMPHKNDLEWAEHRNVLYLMVTTN